MDSLFEERFYKHSPRAELNNLTPAGNKEKPHSGGFHTLTTIITAWNNMPLKGSYFRGVTLVRLVRYLPFCLKSQRKLSKFGSRMSFQMDEYFLLGHAFS